MKTTSIHRALNTLLTNIRIFQQELSLWEKVSQECPQSDVKKSPDVEQNVSTSSTVPTNTIPIQGAPLHENATLKLQQNPLTGGIDLVYSYFNPYTKQAESVTFYGTRIGSRSDWSFGNAPTIYKTP